ncbi:MAG TPA: hypothetical protein VN808_17440 [Stellaceae bacterium]|nr:hypothetical protein [Stellaceae bacterium]
MASKAAQRRDFISELAVMMGDPVLPSPFALEGAAIHALRADRLLREGCLWETAHLWSVRVVRSALAKIGTRRPSHAEGQLDWVHPELRLLVPRGHVSAFEQIVHLGRTICAVCREPVWDAIRSTRTYCSDRCQRIASDAHGRAFTCAYEPCGKTFLRMIAPTSKYQPQYCSPRCAITAANAKRGDLVGIAAERRDAFYSLRSHGTRRGIAFDLSFADFDRIWNESGRWSQRNGAAGFRMLRIDTQHGYHADNVRIGVMGDRPRNYALTDEQIAKIRASRDTGKVLAARYGVALSTIRRAKHAPVETIVEHPVVELEPELMPEPVPELPAPKPRARRQRAITEAVLTSAQVELVRDHHLLGEAEQHGITVDRAIEMMRVSRFTPFALSGTTLHRFRSELCLAGVAFAEADRIAQAVVDRALTLLGVEKPDFETAHGGMTPARIAWLYADHAHLPPVGAHESNTKGRTRKVA